MASDGRASDDEPVGPDAADAVTGMREVPHAFASGIEARRGIDL